MIAPGEARTANVAQIEAGLSAMWRSAAEGPGAESALLRARKLTVSGVGSAEPAAAMTGLLADESMGVAEQAARRVLAACGEGDMLRTQLAILRRLARFTPGDAVGLSRTVARHTVELERYPV